MTTLHRAGATDEEINRAVAEARGWTRESQTMAPAVHGRMWRDTQGARVEWRLVDVVNDPAAWGALLVELKTGGSVSLSYIEERAQWCATVTREPAIYSGWDADKPGRALALAFLGSKGGLDG